MTWPSSSSTHKVGLSTKHFLYLEVDFKLICTIIITLLDMDSGISLKDPHFEEDTFVNWSTILISIVIEDASLFLILVTLSMEEVEVLLSTQKAR